VLYKKKGGKRTAIGSHHIRETTGGGTSLTSWGKTLPGPRGRRGGESQNCERQEDAREVVLPGEKKAQRWVLEDFPQGGKKAGPRTKGKNQRGGPLKSGKKNPSPPTRTPGKKTKRQPAYQLQKQQPAPRETRRREPKKKKDPEDPNNTQQKKKGKKHAPRLKRPKAHKSNRRAKTHKNFWEKD